MVVDGRTCRQQERPGRFLRCLRHAAAALCALLLVVGSASASADDGEDSALAEPAEEGRELGYLLLGSSLVLGLALAGGYYYLRRRQRRDAFGSFDQPIHHNAASFGGRDARTRAVWRPFEASSDNPSMISDEVVGELGATDFARPHPSEPGRECPECSRIFDATILVCPYDTTALREIDRRTSRPGDASVERLDQMACSGCGRRYERSVEFCYYDGLPLTRDTRRKRDKAPSFKACESCGWESAEDAASCPTDGADLVEVDPTATSPLEPAIPMTSCPKCRRYGAPGQAYCPDDGEVLMPMVNVRLTKSPTRGFGPRRKVCRDCGWEYSSHARFCSQDGSKLVALN